MARFGETLFGGSSFVRWALSPFIIVFAILLPLLIPNPTPVAIGITLLVEVMCLALLAGFWLPARYGHWAYRGLAGLVFLGYATYLVHQVFFGEAPLKLIEERGKASPRNAILGFITIGLPCLWFALFGRFTLGKGIDRAARDTRPTAERR